MNATGLTSARFCVTHNIPLQGNWPDSPVISGALIDLINEKLGASLKNFAISSAAIDACYRNELEITQEHMARFKSSDNGMITQRAPHKLGQLAASINLSTTRPHNNTTIIDFGAAPGNMLAQFINARSNIRLVPLTIQSTMSQSLSVGDINQYYHFINKNKNGAVFAPEHYPDLFPHYDGNIFCPKCMQPVCDYICNNPGQFPPTRLLMCDIGDMINYDDNAETGTSTSALDMDYFELAWILFQWADVLENSARKNRRANLVRPSVICKIQRFGHQMLTDAQAVTKLALLYQHAAKRERIMIITKPYASRWHNDEMYVLSIPGELFANTTWRKLPPDTHFLGHTAAMLNRMRYIRDGIVADIKADAEIKKK